MIASPPEPTAARLARVAGALYLVVIVCGIGGEGLVRGPLAAPFDSAQTAANLSGAELPFRVSIIADVVMALSDVALAVLLYFLLRPISELLSLMAMAFRLVQASILGLNLLNLQQAIALAGSSRQGADVLALHFLEAHAAGYDFGLFFFAINCMFVGVLVARSTFLPHALAWPLLAAGVVYLVGSLLRVLAPAAVEAFAPAYAVPLIAELAFCAWLLFKGVTPSSS